MCRDDNSAVIITPKQRRELKHVIVKSSDAEDEIFRNH